MKDEDRKLSEKEFEKKYKDIALAPYRLARLEEKRRREAKEAKRKKEEQFKKNIEETKNLDVSRLEKLANINAILSDFIDSEDWWNAVREFLEDVCGDKSTESVTIVLKRVKDDHWILDAEVV